MNNRIFPFLALAVAIGLFFFYVNPTWTGSIASLKVAIESDDQAIAAASQYTAQQDKLTSARDAIDPSNLARLNAFLPDSVDNVGLILSLNALAASSGLALSNLDITNTAATSNASASNAAAITASPVSSADLSLSAVGSYSALQGFLSGVERSQRLLDIRDLVVKGSETGVYSYQMTLRFYWLH
jgi:Tfp pilus assembly protein PilO